MKSRTIAGVAVLAISLSCVAATQAAWAETKTRTKQVNAGHESIVARHAQWDRNCESLDLPVIEILQPPAHGKVGTGQRTFIRKIGPKCLGSKISGRTLLYFPDAGYAGSDQIIYRVVYKRPRAGSQREFTHNVVLDVVGQPAPTGQSTQTRPSGTDSSESPPKDIHNANQNSQGSPTNERPKPSEQPSSARPASPTPEAPPVVVQTRRTQESEYAIPPQQRQFCTLTQKFREELQQARRANNDIQTEKVVSGLKADIASLLPNGGFTNWVVQVDEVRRLKDGRLAVTLTMDCAVNLASESCILTKASTSPSLQSSPGALRELERIGKGNKLVMSGRLPYANEASPDHWQGAGSPCDAFGRRLQTDTYTAEIDYLAQLK